MSGAKQGDDTVSYAELYKMAATSFHDYENQYLKVTNIYVFTNSLVMAAIGVIIAGKSSAAGIASNLLPLFLCAAGFFLCLQMKGALGLLKVKIVYWEKLLEHLEEQKQVIRKETECHPMGRGPFSSVRIIRGELKRPDKELLIEKGRIQLKSYLFWFKLEYYGLPVWAERKKEEKWLGRIKSFPFVFGCVYVIFACYSIWCILSQAVWGSSSGLEPILLRCFLLP